MLAVNEVFPKPHGWAEKWLNALNNNFQKEDFVDMTNPTEYEAHFKHTFRSLRGSYPELKGRGRWEYGPSADKDQRHIFAAKYKHFNILKGLEMTVYNASRIVLKQTVGGFECSSDLAW